MIVVLIILVVLFFCSNCVLGYLCLEAQENRNLYYTRWLEANKLLDGADIDAVAEGKPAIKQGTSLSPWGAVRKGSHTALNQDRLNKMSDYSRFEIERKRLEEGLEPVDNMQGLSEYYTQRMIELRLEEGWD